MRCAGKFCYVLTFILTALPGWGQPSNPRTSIVIVGSERMVPLIRKLLERFTELHPQVKIEVQGGGSNVGIFKLTRGEADIAALARPAKDGEIRRARRVFGKEPVGIPIAMDAVIFLVNRGNPLTSLSYDQIEGIFTQRIADWSVLNVPLERIHRFIPSASSGSVGIVWARVLNGRGYTRAKQEYETRPKLLRAVINELRAIAFAGMGNTSGVKVLRLQKDTELSPVWPTPETIQNRKYPLAHYLYLYFAEQPTGVLRDLVRFAISPEGQEIVRTAGTGAIPLPFGSQEATRLGQ